MSGVAEQFNRKRERENERDLDREWTCTLFVTRHAVSMNPCRFVLTSELNMRGRRLIPYAYDVAIGHILIVS